MNLNDHIVYISGPMTGIQEFNRPAFFLMERTLLERFKTCTTLNPARITDKHIATSLRFLKEEEKYREYMKHDIELVFSATAIMLLKGWHNSKGANAELALAKALNLLIVYEDEITGGQL